MNKNLFLYGLTNSSQVRLSFIVTLAFSLGFLFLIPVASFAGENMIMSDENTYDARFIGPASSYLGKGDMVETGDINDDGYIDIVFQSNEPGGGVYLIFGDGTDLASDVSLSDDEGYNIRYAGSAGGAYDAIRIGDVNGDGKEDLVFCDATYVYVIFSTLIDDVNIEDLGITKSLAEGTNYNIRYQGVSVSNYYGKYLDIKDVNGDGYSDLILADDDFNADPINPGNEGAVFVLFSTLIDNVSGTGQNKALATAENYSIRFAGYAGMLGITDMSGIIAEDLNGDGSNDLLINDSVSWIIFSTLIDNVAPEETGQNHVLSNASSYNIKLNNIGGGVLYGGMDAGDLNGDGFPDLAISAGGSSVYVFFSTLIDDGGNDTGQTYDVSGGDYSMSFTATTGAGLGSDFGVTIDDINTDGFGDLILCDYWTSPGGVSNAGTTWIIFSTLVENFVNILEYDIDLDIETSYNIKIGGASSGDNLPFMETDAVYTGDFDGNGYNDLVLASSYADSNGLDSGAVYIFFSTLIDNYSNTGNYLSLSSGDNYSIRYDGDSSGDGANLPHSGGLELADLNGDGIGDLIIDHSNNNVAYLIYGGSNIVATPLGISIVLADNPSVDVSVVRQSGTKTLRIKSDGVVVADVNTTFEENTDLNWSGITADASLSLGKTLVTGLTSAPGTGAVHTLYVPKTGNRVYICPEATTLDEIGTACTGGYQLSNEDTNVSVVTIGSQEYWKIDELTGTGGLDQYVEEADELEQTGQNLYPVVFFSIMILGVYQLVLTKKRVATST